MKARTYREIPYNFTSADDRLIIQQLFGPSVWEDVEELRSQRVTGRSARLLMRFMGDLFILHRNPFLYQELVDSPRRRRFLLAAMRKDLTKIEETAKKGTSESNRSAKVQRLVCLCREKAEELHSCLHNAKKQRTLLKKRLGAIVGVENVCMDPFALISHAQIRSDTKKPKPQA